MRYICRRRAGRAGFALKAPSWIFSIWLGGIDCPSIILWVLFNEGWGQYDTERLTAWVKQMDPSRLVNNASGWTDKPDAVCDLLVWIWRTGPRCTECAANTGEYRQWTIDPRLQHKLEQLHTLCRQEVERPDELTKLAIEQLHIAIDVTVARLIRPKTQPPEPSVRMELAIRWMAQNLAERNPVRALCSRRTVSRSRKLPTHWATNTRTTSAARSSISLGRARSLVGSSGAERPNHTAQSRYRVDEPTKEHVAAFPLKPYRSVIGL